MEQHSEILPQLAAFHDGQLNALKRLAIQAHLDVCVECQRKLSEWQALDSALAALPVPEAAADLHSRTLAALAATKSRTMHSLVQASRVRYWAAAAVLIFAAVTTLLWRQEQERSLVETDRPQAQQAVPEPTSSSEGTAESARANAPAPAGQIKAPEEAWAQRDSGQPGLESPKPSREKLSSTAPEPVGAGDSGIPQKSDWPARLQYEEWMALKTQTARLDLRIPEYHAPFEIAEINLVPLFEADFVPVGYMPLAPGLDPAHEAAYSDPVLLTPETAYLVSNLRLEQTSLMARSHEEGPSAEVALKLAEITWRLANLTADHDDVNSAIAAQNLALRHRPELAGKAESRLIFLRALGGN